MRISDGSSDVRSSDLFVFDLCRGEQRRDTIAPFYTADPAALSIARRRKGEPYRKPILRLGAAIAAGEAIGENAALDLGGGSRIGFGDLGARQICDDGVEHLLVAEQGRQQDRVRPANAHVGAGAVPTHRSET